MPALLRAARNASSLESACAGIAMPTDARAPARNGRNLMSRSLSLSGRRRATDDAWAEPVHRLRELVLMPTGDARQGHTRHAHCPSLFHHHRGGGAEAVVSP